MEFLWCVRFRVRLAGDKGIKVGGFGFVGGYNLAMSIFF